MVAKVTLPSMEAEQPHCDAAAFLAMLAYPLDRAKREDFERHAQARWIKWRIAHNRDAHHLLNSDQSEPSRDIRYRAIDGRYTKVGKIIKRLMPAAACATDLLEGRRTTVASFVEAVGEQQVFRENFRRDIWAPAKPVIHRLIAFRSNINFDNIEIDTAQFGDEKTRLWMEAGIVGEETRLWMEYLMSTPDWLPPTLKEAEALRPVIVACPTIRISEADLI